MDTTMPGVNSPSTVNAANLTNFGGSFTVPKPVPTNYNSFIQSLQTELPNLQSEVNTYQTALDKQLSDLMSTNTEIGNKGSYQLDQENKLGVNVMTKELADLNKQLAQRKADYMSQYQTVGEKVSDKAFVTGMQAELQNRSAIELGNLASVQQALQGNIQLARDTASRSTELKYAPIETALKNKLLFYDYNKDRLTSAQKRLADKQAQSYELQLKNIEQIKSDERWQKEKAFDLMNSGKISVKDASEVLNGNKNIITALTSKDIEGNQPGYANVKQDDKLLVGYLKQYRDLLNGKSAFQFATSAELQAQKQNIVSLITAEYKQAKKLGTLDAGVQKLIDGLLGNNSIQTRLSVPSQIKAVDNTLSSFGYDVGYLKGEENASSVLDSLLNSNADSYQNVLDGIFNNSPS